MGEFAFYVIYFSPLHAGGGEAIKSAKGEGVDLWWQVDGRNSCK